MLAVDLGEVVRDLEGLADFVRRQEGIASELGQVADSECGETAVLRASVGWLRDAGDPFSGMPSVVPSGPNRVVCRWAKPPRTWLIVFGEKTWVQLATIWLDFAV